MRKRRTMIDSRHPQAQKKVSVFIMVLIVRKQTQTKDFGNYKYYVGELGLGAASVRTVIFRYKDVGIKSTRVLENMYR